MKIIQTTPSVSSCPKHRALSTVRGAPDTYRPAEQGTGSPLSQGQGKVMPLSSVSSI